MMSDFCIAGFILFISVRSMPFGEMLIFFLTFSSIIIFSAVVCETLIIVFGTLAEVFSIHVARLAVVPTYSFQYALPHTSCQVEYNFLPFSKQTSLQVNSEK